MFLAAAAAASDSTIAPIILGVMGAAITGLVAYLGAKRKNSGSAATASATTIFDAAEAIRKEQRDEIVSLRAELSALKTEVAAMRIESVAMRTESIAMREEMIVLRKESAILHQELLNRTSGEI